MKNPAFEYEVAFSFMANDEHLAVQIADELRDRYRVFLYSKSQKELAGMDGVERFSEVFREKARVCLVLLRDGLYLRFILDAAGFLGRLPTSRKRSLKELYHFSLSEVFLEFPPESC